MSKEPSSIRRRLDRSTSRSPSRSPSGSGSRTPTPVSKKGSDHGSRSPSRTPSRSRSSSSSSLSASSSGSSRSKSTRSHSESRSKSSRSKSRSPTSNARSRSASKAPSGDTARRRSPTPVTKIHVNKLTRNVNKQHLTEIFKTYGPVKSVDLQTDRFHPQLGRGSAYIEYEKSADAEKAIRYMDGGQIDGQEIIVTRFRQRNINRHHNQPINRRNLGGYRNGGGGGGWRRFSPMRR